MGKHSGSARFKIFIRHGAGSGFKWMVNLRCRYCSHELIAKVKDNEFLLYIVCPVCGKAKRM